MFGSMPPFVQDALSTIASRCSKAPVSMVLDFLEDNYEDFEDDEDSRGLANKFVVDHPTYAN